MNKPKFLNAASAGIIGAVLVVVNIFMFIYLETYTTVFWIAFSFSIIACILSLLVLIFGPGIGEKKILYDYIFYPLACYYMIAQILVALISVWLLEDHIFLSFVLQILIVAVFLIFFAAMRKTGQEVKEQQEIRAPEIQEFKAILDSAKAVMSKIDYSASYRKAVQKAIDALASGQVRSTPAAADIESEIKSEIRELSKAINDGNEEAITAVCQNIENLAEERTRVIKSERSMF